MYAQYNVAEAPETKPCNDVTKKVYPLARNHHGTNVKAGVRTNLGRNTRQVPLGCEDAGINQTPNVFLRSFLIKVSVDTSVLVQNYPERVRDLRKWL